MNGEGLPWICESFKRLVEDRACSGLLAQLDIFRGELSRSDDVF